LERFRSGIAKIGEKNQEMVLKRAPPPPPPNSSSLSYCRKSDAEVRFGRFNVSDPDLIGTGNPDPDSKYPDAGRPKWSKARKKENSWF
jgi:hypothetical protein